MSTTRTVIEVDREQLISILIDCERLLGVAMLSGKSLYSSPVRKQVQAYLGSLGELPYRDVHEFVNDGSGHCLDCGADLFDGSHFSRETLEVIESA